MLRALEAKVNSVEEVIEIFKKNKHKLDGDGLALGMQILAKYINPNKEKIIKAHSWQMFNTIRLFSITLNRVVELRVAKKDIEALASYKWLISEKEKELYFEFKQDNC